MLDLSLETEALAERLARAKRLSVEQLIRSALEERARAEGLSLEAHARDPSPGAVSARRSRTDRLVASFAALPILDSRSPREIMDELNSP